MDLADTAGSHLYKTKNSKTGDIVTKMAGRRELVAGMIADGFQTADHSMGKSMLVKG